MDILHIVDLWVYILKSLVRTRDFKKALFYFLCLFHNWKLGILSHSLRPSIASLRVKCGVQKFKDACDRQDVHLRSAGSPMHTHTTLF